MHLVLLALAAAFFPTVLAAVVILLSQPRRLPLLSAYLAGGLTISIGLGLGSSRPSRPRTRSTRAGRR